MCAREREREVVCVCVCVRTCMHARAHVKSGWVGVRVKSGCVVQVCVNVSVWWWQRSRINASGSRVILCTGQSAHTGSDVGEGEVPGGPHHLARWQAHHSAGRGKTALQLSDTDLKQTEAQSAHAESANKGVN